MKLPESPKIGVIILAAGSSTRMDGKPKQMLEFEGRTLLRRAAETALEAGFSAVVVLGANADRMRKEIDDLPLEIAFNENWENGLASSVKTGLRILEKKNPDAVIVTLCDQPLVAKEVLHRLRNAFCATNKPIAASRYDRTAGVPALFAREIFNELKSLQNDEGAKKIIKKDERRIVLVDVPEAAFDVDTRQDFERLKRLH